MSTDAATSANALPHEATLPDDPETLKGMIRELLAMLHNRDQELSGVRQRLDQLLRRLYGPKGEQFRPDQPTLFEGGVIPATTSPSTPVSVEPEPVTNRTGLVPEARPRARLRGRAGGHRGGNETLAVEPVDGIRGSIRPN